MSLSALHIDFNKTKIHLVSKVANMKHVQLFYNVYFYTHTNRINQVHLNCTTAINEASVNMLHSGSEIPKWSQQYGTKQCATHKGGNYMHPLDAAESLLTH